MIFWQIWSLKDHDDLKHPKDFPLFVYKWNVAYYSTLPLSNDDCYKNYTIRLQCEPECGWTVEGVQSVRMCACMFEASLWNKAPSASGGLTAGENLIRHFKDSSHWSLTENKRDQTSLRNERERERCRRLLYGMCNSPGFLLLLQMTPNGQTVCTCVYVCIGLCVANIKEVVLLH